MMSTLLLARYAPMFVGPLPLFSLVIWLLLANVFNWSTIERYCLEIIPVLFIVGVPIFGLMGDDGILCLRFLERLHVGIVALGRDPSSMRFYEVAKKIIKRFFEAEYRIRDNPQKTKRSIIEQTRLFVVFVGKILALPIVVPHELMSIDLSSKPGYLSLWEEIKSSNLPVKIIRLLLYLLFAHFYMINRFNIIKNQILVKVHLNQRLVNYLLNINMLYEHPLIIRH